MMSRFLTDTINVYRYIKGNFCNRTQRAPFAITATCGGARTAARAIGSSDDSTSILPLKLNPESLDASAD